MDHPLIREGLLQQAKTHSRRDTMSKNHALMSALGPLHAIARAYDLNNLDSDGARKEWGQSPDRHRTPLESVTIYDDQGGNRLLSLKDCMQARIAVRTEMGLEEALKPLLKIAKAYHANLLEEDARKYIGADKAQSTKSPASIVLYSDKGGNPLLTLSHVLYAERVLSEVSAGDEDNQPFSTEQRLQIALTALEDISEGRGMFGVTADADLEWAMQHATKAVSAITRTRAA
jgi:hypothetical protein